MAKFKKGEKMIVAMFQCDECGTGSMIVGTEPELEQEKVYHCIHCGYKGKRLYTYDDFIVIVKGGF